MVKCNILIVEDERLIAETLKEQLEETGHTITGIANSAESAMSLIQSTKPNLLIIDIRLKGAVDGIQLALQVHQTIDKLPVVFLSAHSAQSFPDLSLLDPSLFLCLTKPYLETDLLDAIQKLGC